MAGKLNRDLSVQIDGDPKGWNRACEQAIKKAQKLEREVERLNAKLKKVGDKQPIEQTSSLMTSMLTKIGELGPAKVGLVTAAIASLPVTATVAAAGVTAAIGAGLAGIGLAAAAQSSEVKTEFASLKSDVADGLQDAAEPLEDSLLHAMGVARRVFGSFEPELDQAFERLAPHIDGFLTDWGDGISRLSDLVVPLGDAFGAQLDSLGDRGPEIFESLQDAAQNLIDVAERNPTALADLVEFAADAVEGASNVIVWLEKIGRLIAWLNDSPFIAPLEGKSNTEAWADSLEELDHILNDTTTQTGSTSYATTVLGDGMNDAAEKASNLSESVEELTAALEEYFEPALSALSASNRWADGLAEAKEALDKGNVSTRQRSELLEGLLKDLADLGSAESEATGQIKDTTAAFDGNIGMLVRLAGTSENGQAALDGLATSFGYTIERAKGATIVTDRFGNRVKVLPSGKVTVIKAETTAAERRLKTVQDRLNALRNRVVTVTVNTMYANPSGQKAINRKVTYSAAGGFVSGPGTSTSDSIPAMLSDGEYVINARATARHRELLDAINSNRFARGGIVGYATGGPVRATVPLGEFLDRWLGSAQGTTKSDVTKAIRARKDAVDQLRKAERKLREDRRNKRSARTIADDEARVAKERRDLATATDKLRATEAKYNRAKLTPVAKLQQGLTLGIKNTAAFIKNITKLADMGFGELAQQLLAMGGPDAERIAAGAVKLSKSKLKSLNTQAVTASKQQAQLAALPNILLVRAAQKSGAKSVADIMRATGLSEEDLAEAYAAMGYAAGGIERYARGGRRPGPGIAARPTVLFGEGRYPEGFVPYDPAHRARAVGLVSQMARDFGMVRGSGGGTTQVINVTVQGAIDPIGTARTIEKTLRTLVRTNGGVKLNL